MTDTHTGEGHSILLNAHIHYTVAVLFFALENRDAGISLYKFLEHLSNNERAGI